MYIEERQEQEREEREERAAEAVEAPAAAAENEEQCSMVPTAMKTETETGREFSTAIAEFQTMCNRKGGRGSQCHAHTMPLYRANTIEHTQKMPAKPFFLST